MSTTDGERSSGPRVRPIAVVVEDDPDVRLALVDLLDAEGFFVVGVHSLAHARELLGRVTPKLMLLDLELGDGRGEALVEAWRASGRPLSGIVLATGDPDAASIAAAHGIALCTKPFAYDALVAIVRGIRDEREDDLSSAG